MENKGGIAGQELRSGNGYPNFPKNHLTGGSLIVDNIDFGLSGRMCKGIHMNAFQECVLKQDSCFISVNKERERNGYSQ